MEFEFDEAKSRANKQKHGIDFEEAQQLWDDENLVHVSARSHGEPRYLAIGFIGLRPWTACITYRNGRIRLISVRRARAEEVAHYES